jgi:5-deoxy-glucuronate isomerase
VSDSERHLPAGTLRTGDWDLELGPDRAGWRFSGLRIARLAPGGVLRLDTGGAELIVVPFEGAVDAVVDGATYALRGRSGVFASATDVLYVPRDSSLELTSGSGARVALPSADARRRFPVQLVRGEDVPVEVRGGGVMTRLVRDFGGTVAIQADRLIACEVITPAGNWSSYPPHKHELDSESESELEEIYYYEIADGPAGPGVAYQRVSSSPDHEIEVLAEVRSGDVVLIPYGWHGPSMAAPGNDLYYLNVMAGPGAERVWRITDHPESGWVRQGWPQLGPDPRAVDGFR